MKYDEKVLKGQRALLLMQTFSMLGFSVLFSSLVLYTTQALKIESHFAVALTGGFIALNYTLHLLGGYLGGRFLSYRALFMIGMILQAIGALIISYETVETLVIGISFFLTGCGLNVICINCMLTQLFNPHDKRRESAFLWNYSGMNLGFLIGFTVSGFFQLERNFHALFMFASIGSILSFILTILNWKHLIDKDTHYSASKKKRNKISIAFLMIIALVGLLTVLLRHIAVANALIAITGVSIACLFAYLAWKEPSQEKAKKLYAFLILALSSLIFWTLYQMAPMGLTLFYERNVEHDLFGYRIPPQWLQNTNTLIIILGGPLLAAANTRLRRRGRKISLPFQFTTALFLIGFGYLLLPIGIHYANTEGYSSIGWVLGTFAFQSIGELFISPIGYAMIGQLISSRLQPLAMGTWMMVSGVAATLSNYFSQDALGKLDVQRPLETNGGYSKVFLYLAIASLFASLILFFLRPFLHRLIQEKSNFKSIEPITHIVSQE